MAEVFGVDAFSPREVADRVESVGVVKARMPLPQVFMLGVLAGGFIGLGALGNVLVLSDPSLSWAVARLLGGLVFSIGLVLVVVAGAELFTGNNLLVMAWADGRITAREVLRNWLVVSLANLVGATGLALLVFLSGHALGNDGLIAQKYVAIASAKCALPLQEAFFRGVLCNVLVCLAVWMAMAGRTLVDKVVVIVFPITLFVAAGFEHSIANMYLVPMGMLLAGDGAGAPTMAGFIGNLVPVIAGNLAGGSVLVALVYYVVYRRAVGAGGALQSAGGIDDR